jgi:hypothetical protein
MRFDLCTSIVIFGMAIAATPCVASQAALIEEGMSYYQARINLRASGWAPTNYAKEEDKSETAEGEKLDELMRAEFVKLGWTEVGACFPTGLGQCFGIWRRRDKLLVIELLSDPKVCTHIYFYYQVRLHQSLKNGTRPTREEWDMRSADIVRDSHPKWRRQW